MAASVRAWKEAGDALADAMAALNVKQVRKIDDMRADGWFTAREFAARCGRDTQTVKAMLDKSSKFERCEARVGSTRVTAYRLKPAR